MPEAAVIVILGAIACAISYYAGWAMRHGREEQPQPPSPPPKREGSVAMTFRRPDGSVYKDHAVEFSTTDLNPDGVWRASDVLVPSPTSPSEAVGFTVRVGEYVVWKTLLLPRVVRPDEELRITFDWLEPPS